ncbi:Leucine-rich repeat neuronal protein 3 Neuronal leucine-rich repeat protein 3 [Larimichthys crocea]|uniref:Leucine-rich repeat neuronal protein 3 Neuronal leucine-rich repeat protein 3 n=1 Tax=Larimichthys crocea TaxID=215358 RepID=A0A6G0HQK2_LARCR|nr:Leucine-rich repeat neuronal protein 3 Neuronal leucine-rich repeat protein 3 [Larimichthys crocea]
MKDVSFVDLFVGLAMASFVVATEERPDCPKLCVCEIRPWFSPSSVYMEAQTVDCNDLGLFSLPEKLPVGTQVLLLQTNNVAKIDQPLDYLANITEIDLSQNNLSSISDVHLGNLPQLLSLHMEENWIRELPERCLAEVATLQELYMNHNLISFISPLAFQGLSNLVRLHLNSNKLKVIKKEWFDPMPNLEIPDDRRKSCSFY